MDWKDWEPYYMEIVREFGFSVEMDRKSGVILAEILKHRHILGKEELREIIEGKDVLVVGPLANNIPKKDVIISTDSSTSICLKNGIIPDLIVTDLDGDVEDQIKASLLGSIAVIHAHGDNMEAIRKYAPRFKGKLAGTVQCEPFPPLMNFGGFTDGDRAVFMAESLGAKQIYITGFDFKDPLEKQGKNRKIKERKLVWAERLISLFEVRFI